MNVENKIGAKIEDYIHKSEISLSDFANRCGLSLYCVRDVILNPRRRHMKTVSKLARGLGCSPEEVLRLM